MGSTIDFIIPDVNDSTDIITNAYVNVPEGPGPFPGVVVAFHKDGIDDFTKWVVDDLAGNGYAAIAPNHYHALPPGMDIERRREFLADEQMALDLKSAADWLEGQKKVDGDRLALLGHCMGGRTTWWTGSTRLPCRTGGRYGAPSGTSCRAAPPGFPRSSG